MTDSRVSRAGVDALVAVPADRWVSTAELEALVNPDPSRVLSRLGLEVLTKALAPGETGGAVTASLPRLGVALVAHTGPAARSGVVAATLPRLRATVAGTRALPSVAVRLPRLRAALTGEVRGTGSHLPALTADLHGAVLVVVHTDTAWGNDGYSYTGTTDVDYQPAVAPPPPGLHRQDVRRVHQSLPTPDLVKGRPQ